MLAAGVSLMALSCSSGDKIREFYVIVEPQMSARFVSDLSEIARRHGLTASVGQATDDRGNTMRVVEAKGNLLRLWSQNMPLSGEENPTVCGPHQEPHPDPSQFIVSLRGSVPFMLTNRAEQLQLNLIADLKSAHYDVRMVPVDCGASALTPRR